MIKDLRAIVSETLSEAGTPSSSKRGPEGPVLGPDGKLDVAELLSQRQGGPAPFGRADRSRFLQALDEALVRLEVR